MYFFFPSGAQCFDFLPCVPPLQNLFSELFVCSKGYITARISQRDLYFSKDQSPVFKGKNLEEGYFFLGKGNGRRARESASALEIMTEALKET